MKKTRILQKIKKGRYFMYFTPLLLSEVKKGPYLIVHNKYQTMDSIDYYFAEITSPYQSHYTTLDQVYDCKKGMIPNKIQLQTPFLTFFKCIPTILPKLKQRMLHQILRKITGDETFTYVAFEPVLHYSWDNNTLTNTLFPIKHVK